MFAVKKNKSPKIHLFKDCTTASPDKENKINSNILLVFFLKFKAQITFQILFLSISHGLCSIKLSSN